MKPICLIGTACVVSALSATAQAGLFKANPAPSTPFLDHPQSMRADPARAPFDRVWINPSNHAWERVKGFDRVAILPVNTSYLKATPQQRAEAQKMASYMHEQFQGEFARSGKYHVVNQPGGKTLKMELALVQLKPTNVAGNVVATGAGAGLGLSF